MIKCYSQLAYDKYIEDNFATTLRASGGVYGGVARFWLSIIKTSLARYVLGTRAVWVVSMCRRQRLLWKRLTKTTRAVW